MKRKQQEQISVHESKVPLTSSEMSSLWSSYLIISMIYHVFKYFKRHVYAPDIRAYIEFQHQISGDHLKIIGSLLEQDNFPIPRGITAEDVNPDAPRLFSDVFYLIYARNMAKLAMIISATSFSEATRKDIRQTFYQFTNALQEIHQQTTDLLSARGALSRPPSIPVPKKVEFVKKQSFLSGFLHHKRPLSSMEINQLFQNAQANALGKALLLGFLQVTKSKELKELFTRGKEMSNKLYKEFTDVLLGEDLQIPPTHDGEVLPSTQSPFSDRLMLYHIAVLAPSGLGNYGMAMASSQRTDLAAMFAKVMGEVGLYAEDGANLLIKNGWMEQPPLAPDRKA